MGWTNSHLHEFRVGDARYGEPDPEYDEGDVRDERSVRLFEVAPGVNDSFLSPSIRFSLLPSSVRIVGEGALPVETRVC